MIELRDLFCDIEKHYFNMLDIGESFLECLDKGKRSISWCLSAQLYSMG